MAPTENWTRIAHLVRPQGRRGELLADLLTDFPGRFEHLEGAALLPRPPSIGDARPVVLEGHWLHKGRVVLKFQGTNSITEAEALRGLDLAVPQEARVPLADGAVYIDDLIGCSLVDTNQAGGPVVGTVRDAVAQPQATDLLVVAGADGAEHLVPFAKAYLVRMDLTARRVEMALPAGLLGINAPIGAEAPAPQQTQAPRETHRTRR